MNHVGLLLKRSFIHGSVPSSGPAGMLWINFASEIIGVMGEHDKVAVMISTRTGQIILPEGQTIDKAAEEFWSTVRFLATERLPIDPTTRDVGYRPADPAVEKPPVRKSWFRRIFD